MKVLDSRIALGKEEMRRGTFPESSDPFFTGDRSIGVHGPVVPLGSPHQLDVGLEADFHHVRRLGAGHRHGAGGTAGKEAGENAGI